MRSKASIRVSAVASNLVACLCIFVLSGCFAGDEHNAEVERLMKLDAASMTQEASTMSNEQKAALLVSSWKRHPSSRFLNEVFKLEGFDLARQLVGRVQAKDSYVVTVEMIDFLIEMRDAGSLTQPNIESLNLRDLCTRNAPGEAICSERLGRLLSP